MTILALILVIGIAWHNAPPPALSTPQELAEWSECDPAQIAHWIGGKVRYTEQGRWDPAELVMARQAGDCKGASAVAVAALSRCAGYDARIAVLNPASGQGRAHAVALYTDHRGRRGVVDSGNQRDYAPGTDWWEVVGEKWRIKP